MSETPNWKYAEILAASYKLPHRVICLCGSVRFREQFEQIAQELTIEDNAIILMPTIFNHAAMHDENDADMLKMKDRLDAIHFQKVRMATCVYIIDIDGYIGESTSREIRYARRLRKLVRYWSKEKQSTATIPFTCDHCERAECEEPRRTVFGKPRIWAYCGGCGHMSYRTTKGEGLGNKNELWEIEKT